MHDGHEIDIDERAVAFVLGELADAEAEAFAREIEHDEALRKRVDAVRQCVSGLRMPPMAEPSREAVRRVLALLPRAEERPTSGSLFDLVGLVVAELVRDSRAPSVVPGFRGGRGHMLAYRGELAAVDLRVSEVAGARFAMMRLTGVIETGVDASKVRVQIRAANGGEVQSVVLDEGLIFSIELPPGVYDLALSDGVRAMLVPSVEVR